MKIDHRLSEKNQVSAKYSQQRGSAVPFDCFKTLIDPCGSGSNKSTAHVFAINDTHTFNPTLLLTTTFGFTRGAMRIFAYNSSLNSDPLEHVGLSLVSEVEWLQWRTRYVHERLP